MAAGVLMLLTDPDEWGQAIGNTAWLLHHLIHVLRMGAYRVSIYASTDREYIVPSYIHMCPQYNLPFCIINMAFGGFRTMGVGVGAVEIWLRINKFNLKRRWHKLNLPKTNMGN